MISMRETKFRPIVKLYFPFFEKEGEKINADFPKVHCRTYFSYPPEDAPEHGFCRIYMDCILNSVESDKSDNVGLGILIYDFDQTLTINAEISWGDPSGETEQCLFDEPVNVTEQILLEIQERLPSMVDKLREAILSNPYGK